MVRLDSRARAFEADALDDNRVERALQEPLDLALGLAALALLRLRGGLDLRGDLGSTPSWSTTGCGVLRLNEVKQVHETLNRDLGVNLTVVDASDLFFAHLAGVEDSEQKRRIIRNTFIDYTL